MPRVNKDLERRMAARRERERRRSPATQPRYRFAPAEEDGAIEAADDEAEQPAPAATNGASRTTAVATRPASPRPSLAHSSTYAEDYSYMRADLRRVFIVVGILLVALIALSFVLPH